MGSKIHELFSTSTMKVMELKDTVVAIDACTWLHQFLKVTRMSNHLGTRLVLMDKTCRVINHLRGFLFRTAFLVRHHIWPVFIFDGAASTKIGRVSRAVSRSLHEHHVGLKQVHEEAMKLGMEQMARKIGSRMEFMYPIAEQEVKRLLMYMGMPVIDAPSEGEAQCSQLLMDGLVDHVLSLDADAVLFGASSVITGLKATSRSKECQHVNLQHTLNAHGLTREQLIDIAILVGTDFNEKIRGIGPKTALNLINKHGRIETIALNESGYDFSPLGICQPRKRHRSNFLDQLRETFMDPLVVDGINQLSWNSIDDTHVERFLLEEHSFSPSSVKKAIKTVQAAVG